LRAGDNGEEGWKCSVVAVAVCLCLCLCLCDCVRAMCMHVHGIVWATVVQARLLIVCRLVMLCHRLKSPPLFLCSARKCVGRMSMPSLPPSVPEADPTLTIPSPFPPCLLSSRMTQRLRNKITFTAKCGAQCRLTCFPPPSVSSPRACLASPTLHVLRGQL